MAERMPPLQEPDGLPSGRAALPADSLSKPFLGPQGDENRAASQISKSTICARNIVISVA